MIVDASALLAVLLGEPEGPEFKLMIARSKDSPLMSPVNYLEAALRVDRKGLESKAAELDPLIAAMDIEIAPTTKEQAKLAREAYQAFGKGNHKARLNMGDCFAYALSKARGEPLLFKGDDFPQTDVEAAI